MMDRESRAERGSAFVSMMGDPVDAAAFDAAKEAYLGMGGGDPQDFRATVVDVLADMGHWDGRPDALAEAADRIDRGRPAMAAGEGVLFDAVVDVLVARLAAAGEDPVQALRTAHMHVEAEASEDEGFDEGDEDGFSLGGR